MNLITTLEQKLNPILLKAFDINTKKEVVESYRNNNDGSILYSTLIRVALTSTFIEQFNKYLCYQLLGIDIASNNYEFTLGNVVKASYNYSIKDYFEDTNEEYVIYSGLNPIDNPKAINLEPILPYQELMASFTGKVGFINVSNIKKDSIKNLNYIDLCVNINNPDFIYLQECTPIT